MTAEQMPLIDTHASPSRRLGSALIDAAVAYLGTGAVIGGSLLALSVALEYLSRIFGFEMPNSSNPIAVWIFVSIVVVLTAASWVAYLGVSNGIGSSVGKQILGLRVVKRNGEKLGVRRGVARALVSLAFLFTGIILIDYAWMVFDDRGRTLHDRFTGAYVFRAAKSAQTIGSPGATGLRAHGASLASRE
jgi:uncharacterized RDD family membrane protein YckC